MTTDPQKLGGIAALIEEALHLTGFAMFLTVLDPAGYEGQVQRVVFLVENQVAAFIVNLLIYVVFGVVLVFLALHVRLKDGSPVIIPTATVFVLIWAGLVIASGMIANNGNATVVYLFSEKQNQAVLLWLAMGAVQEALGGGNEIMVSLWVLLLSWPPLRTDKLPKMFNYHGGASRPGRNTDSRPAT